MRHLERVFGQATLLSPLCVALRSRASSHEPAPRSLPPTPHHPLKARGADILRSIAEHGLPCGQSICVRPLRLLRACAGAGEYSAGKEGAGSK